MRPVAVFAVGALLLLCACSDDDQGNPDGGVTPRDAGPKRDGSQPQCKRPPVTECEPPGTRPICPDSWFCPGCTCEGTAAASACDPLTQDCQRFCTGCYPAEYEHCGATQNLEVLGRCGYCFMTDAGVFPEDCDKLDEIMALKRRDGGG